jgi:aspartyl-tRNA(Asn)/glutamyl-tRNA(Gln) amidotransferase subunit B
LAETTLAEEIAGSGFEAVIGMEVHAELLTRSKMFCACSAEFGGEPNTRCCPVCLGLPGSLPVANRQAVEFVVRAAMALNCEINRETFFHRKNYFYPDLPKGYQISQYGDTPIGVRGWIEIETEDGGVKRIGIRRVHLEEDTGKLLHSSPSESEVDYNRSGVPLMEIVTEHDPRPGFDQINTAYEAREYIMQLRQILLYLGVCDGKMEEGSLRCEPNVSVRPVGSREYGTRTELKNLNSFRSVYRGLEYEIRRQIETIRSGGTVVHETRRWDEETEVTAPMRGKELEQEYRYFPEPDLLPFRFDEEQLERLRSELPELPLQRRRRFQEMGLSRADAAALTSEKAIADWFEEAAREYGEPRTIANWVLSELLRLLNLTGESILSCRVRPAQLAGLVRLIDDGTISGKIAKSVFEEMFRTGREAREIVEASGQTQISDEEAILSAVRKVVAANEKVAADVRGGKEKSIGFLVGQVMKETGGRANPRLVNELLRRELGIG